MTTPVKMYRYVVPSDAHREGWGIFIIDSTGYFSAVSDYGDYAYLWNAHGMADFRQFVVRLARDWDYAATKLGGYDKNHRFDTERTGKDLKRELLNMRRERALEKEDAREEWDNIHDFQHGNLSVEQWYERSTVFSNPSEHMRYRRDSDLEAFCKKLLPRLAAVVRAELEAEGLSASPQYEST